MALILLMKDIFKFIIAILIPQLAAGLGSIFTASSVSTWYLTLNKPSFNPPSWVFGPVWTALFILMGISLFLVWKKKVDKKAMAFFGVQLGLNVLWSIFFFGLRNPALAFVEIIVLWSAILINIIYFYKISKPAAYLLVPYILWVSFAAVLNFTIFYLNF
jgi:tryptophan-rich sensory protein